MYYKNLGHSIVELVGLIGQFCKNVRYSHSNEAKVRKTADIYCRKTEMACFGIGHWMRIQNSIRMENHDAFNIGLN